MAKKKPPVKFKTVVLDTVSPLYNLCMDYVCEKNGWDHPADAPHGKGWAAVRLEFSRGINSLAQWADKLGATLIIIDHSKEEVIEMATANITKISFAMSGQARSIILPVPDHIWFLGYANEDKPSITDASDALVSGSTARCLFISGTNRVEAGCRDPNITKKIIAPLPKTDQFAYINKALYQEKK